jgi:hypothetical protein
MSKLGGDEILTTLEDEDVASLLEKNKQMQAQIK